MKGKEIFLSDFIDEFKWADKHAFLITTENKGRVINYNIDEIKNLIDEKINIRMYIFPLEVQEGRVVKKEYHTNYVYFDIDKSAEEVQGLLQRLEGLGLLPNFLVLTGRHFAFLYKFQESISSKDYEKYQRLFEKFGLTSDHKGNEYNTSVRIPESYNTKVNKQVKWYLLTDKKYTYEEIEKIQTPRCKLIEVLDQNFEYHRYEGWRLMSYVYVFRNAENEFIEKSKLWKKVVVEQTPEYRINRSREEIQRSKEGNEKENFYTCINISQWDLSKINSTFAYKDLFEEHPCKNCIFSTSKLPPYRNLYSAPLLTLKRNKFATSKYEFDGNIVKREGVIITNSFYITNIVRSNWKGNSSLFFIWEDEKEILAFDINDKTHLNTLKAKTNIIDEPLLKRILQEYLRVNSLNKKLDEINGYTGVYNKQWNVRNVHYHGFIFTDPHTEVEALGNFEIFKNALRDILKISIEREHTEIQMAIALSLFSAYRFIENYPYTENYSIFFTGETGTGKTLSAKIGNSLWRKAENITRWSSISLPFIANTLDKCKGFVVIDELAFSEEDERDNIEKLYNLLNVSSRKNMKMNTTELQVNFAFSAEQHVGDKILRKFESTGLARRLFIIYVHDFNKEDYVKYLNILNENYGFIYNLPLQPTQVKLDIKIDYAKKRVLETMLGLYYTLVDYLGLQDSGVEERWFRSLFDAQLETITEKALYHIRKEQEELIKLRLDNTLYNEKRRININSFQAKDLATLLLHAFSLQPHAMNRKVNSKGKSYEYLEVQISANNLYNRVRKGEQITKQEAETALNIASNIIETYIKDITKKIMFKKATIDIIERVITPNILETPKELQENDFI